MADDIYVIMETIPCESSIVIALHSLEKSSFPAPWSKKQICEEINRDDSLCLVIDESENIYEVKDAPDLKSVVAYSTSRVMLYDNTVDVFRIATLPECRRKGFARRLLETTEMKTLEYLDRPSFFMLEVSESNLPAIHLYGSLGYKIIHRRKSYYGDSSAALIMRKDIID